MKLVAVVVVAGGKKELNEAKLRRQNYRYRENSRNL